MAKRRSIESRVATLERQAAEVRVRAVEAGEFRLVDRNGRVRAVLEMSRQGPRLAMLQEDGCIAIEVTLAADGPGIRLSDDAGQARVFIGATRDAARLGMADGDGHQRLFLGVSAKGEPTITIYDDRQREVWEAPKP